MPPKRNSLHLEASRRENGPDKWTKFSLIVCGNTVLKIQEVIADFPYKALPVSTVLSALKGMHVRVVCLSDGSYKLYLQTCLLGGMYAGRLPSVDEHSAEQIGIFDENVSDKQVSARLAAIMPRNTFSSITVYTTEYQFIGLSEERPSRIIVLTPIAWEWFVNVLRTVVWAKGDTSSGNQVVSAILGSEDEEDIKALEETFHSNQNVVVAFLLERHRGYRRFNVDLQNSPTTACVAKGRENVVVVGNKIADGAVAVGNKIAENAVAVKNNYCVIL
ncbi:MAG: hypothetical protein LLG04_14070 [Parachlamydia sp.]|nr:hypothetical protein [Parachlamydia sp.]